MLPQYNKFYLPNQPADRRTRQWIILGWTALAGLLWGFSPFTFLPTPLEVWQALGDLWTNYNLADQLVVSFVLNIQAVLLSLVLSLLLAYLSTFMLMRPVIEAFGRLRFLSMVGLSFAFTVLTSSGHALKLSMLVFTISVFFVTGMADVIAGIPQEQYDLARTLRMTEWEVLWEVVILGTADEAFVVLRQNAAIGWMMLSFVESMERSEGGIGALLATQDKYFHMAAIMGVQLLVLGLGLGQDYSLGWLRNLCCPYADLTRRRG
jgi:NitT/TauT family transport system permease protein